MSLLVAEQRIEVATDKLLILAGRSEDERRWIEAGLVKYGEVFLEAERRKLALRVCWSKDESWKLGLDIYRPFWQEFWEEYEQVNHDLLPDDPTYSLTRPGIALSTTTDLWTLTVGTSGQLRILESYISGEATASAVNRVGLNLASTNGTTPTAYTPEKFNSRSPAAVATVATAWTTQPTRSTNSKVLQAFNAFGGSDRFVPQPGEEIYATGTGTSEQYSFRSLSGVSTVTAHCVWEEL